MNIYIVGTLLIGYFAFSLLYKKAHRYLYDLVWRGIIIGFVLLTAEQTVAISQNQWLILVGVFISAFIMAMVAMRTTAVYQTFVAVIAAPITEEFLFRGFILSVVTGTNFERILITSILFGVWHLKNLRVLTFSLLIYQVIYAFVFGFPLGYLAIYSQSLFLPILVHTINNAGASMIHRKLPFLRQEKNSS